ncbi:hypothetical protein J2S74_002907 [Evansella vedderi]|uniref:Initiator Rep protein WH1 domain-containing protein n=1 Tax=Evansella vedderi TaxID=38282 RepID=A0ABT9ZWB9_9BACI|nr:RepB family plasmid replication initiator protein [Evansella vedderi]MDQ0255525.1 hypothetical protein [Evansella vedderi]
MEGKTTLSLFKHGRILDKNEMKVKELSLLSKTILKTLDKASEKYEVILDKHAGKKRDNREMIDTLALTQDFANKLKNQNTYELKNVLLFISRELVDLLDKNRTEDIDKEKQILIFKERVLEEALKLRKNNSKKVPLERNHAEAPLWSASSPAAKTLIKIQKQNGELVEERTGFRKILYKNQFGKYLTSTDFRVFLGLQRLWELKGGTKTFTFHFGELCETIDYNKDGGNYELIGASLSKLITTSIIMEDYKDPELKKSVRIEIQNIFQGGIVDKRKKIAEITFNDYLHKGLKENNVVRINLSIFQDLDSITAKLMYPMITSLLKDNRELELDDIIENLVLKDVPRNRTLKRIRAALNDLKQYNIISDFEMIREGRPYKRVRIEPTEQLLESFEEGIVVSE